MMKEMAFLSRPGRDWRLGILGQGEYRISNIQCPTPNWKPTVSTFEFTLRDSTFGYPLGVRYSTLRRKSGSWRSCGLRLHGARGRGRRLLAGRQLGNQEIRQPGDWAIRPCWRQSLATLQECKLHQATIRTIYGTIKVERPTIMATGLIGLFQFSSFNL